MHRDIKSTRTPVYLSDWQRLLEFTKLLRPVVPWLRQQGVKLHVYLDNWLICAESPEQAQMHSEMTIALHPRLGWVINFEKSDLTPSQEFQFLGMHFNTGTPAENASQGPVSTGWATPSSQQEIYAGCWAWWCSWQRWYVVEGYDSDQSSGGLPQHGASGPGIGQTRSQFLSGFYKKWPGGHHQQSCKVFPSPLRKRKSRCSQMRPTPAGEPD